MNRDSGLRCFSFVVFLLLLALWVGACGGKRRTSCNACKQGEERCSPDGLSLLICTKSPASGCWGFSTKRCQDGLVCTLPKRVGGKLSCALKENSCENSCISGTKQCNVQTVMLCTKDSVSGCPLWIPEETCPSDKPCEKGACKDTSVCTPKKPQDSKKCVGSAVHWFDDCGKQGAQIEVCTSPKTCKSGACEGPSGCTPKKPQNSKKCIGNTIYWFDDCGKQGSRVQQCAANEQCTQAQCKPKGCSPTDAQHAKKCVGNAIYWFDNCDKQRDIVGTCAASKKCEKGACVDAGCPASSNQCSAGASRCQGSNIQQCNPNATTGCYEWSAAIPCASGLVCSNGVCAQDPGSLRHCKAGILGSCKKDSDCCSKSQTCKRVGFLKFCGRCNSDSDCPKDNFGLPTKCCNRQHCALSCS